MRVGSGAAMLDARTVGGGDRADLAAPPKRDRLALGAGFGGVGELPSFAGIRLLGCC